MIYRSNLVAPDLQPHFKHAQSRVLGHSFGHDVLSDWADKSPDDPVFGLYTKCGFWTHDEAAILYNVAKLNPGRWLDIGAHTGWTTAHLVKAGCTVTSLEPMTRLEGWLHRFETNLSTEWYGLEALYHLRSDEYFGTLTVDEAGRFRGVVIDGDHNPPYPLNDAKGALSVLEDDGVVMFHDAMGGPVWDGIYYLLDHGYQCHVYFTPHVVAACYRLAFRDSHLPTHVPDPAINWREIKVNHMKEFDWKRVTHDAIP